MPRVVLVALIAFALAMVTTAACRAPVTEVAVVPPTTLAPPPGGTESPAATDDAPPAAPSEQAAVRVPLAGALADPEAEVSGMAWFGQDLVLLPQYPGWATEEGDAGRALFAITRADLLAAVDGTASGPLVPREIPFDAGGLFESIPGFEGFEAIAFAGERAFLSIEAETEDGEMSSYLVVADVAPDLSGLSVIEDSLTEVPLPVSLDNMSTESLLVAGDLVMAIFEANGSNINPRPVAPAFDLDLRPSDPIVFPTIEYRVTDATAMDADGQFWVSNFFWPGEAELLSPADDALAAAHGEGPTHQANVAVERLVEMRYDGEGIRLTGRPPIQLEMAGDDFTRNWEGAVRLDDRGFLIVTDKFPETVLAFVALPSAP